MATLMGEKGERLAVSGKRVKKAVRR